MLCEKDCVQLKKERKQRAANAGEDRGGKEHSLIANRTVNLGSHYRNQYRALLNTQKRTDTGPNYTTPGYIPKDCGSIYHKDIGATVLIATRFTAEKWNQPRCPSADTWIKKVGFYSTMVKKKIALTGKGMAMEITL